MGRKHTGIIKNKNSITIEFRYKRQLCRETIKLKPSPNNIKFAINKRAQILIEIQTRIFNYHNHFPDSWRAKHFGHTPNSMRLESAIDRWIQLRIVKKSTESQYKTYKKVIFEHFDKNMDVKSIRQSDIDMYISKLSKKIGPGTVHSYCGVLNGTLRMLFEDGILSKKLRFNLPKLKTQRKVDPFSDDELREIIKVLPERLKMFTIFNVETGLRTGEMFALRWDDVDWQKKQIIVKHNIHNGKLTSTKTGEERTIDLTNIAHNILKQAQHLVCEFVFLDHQNCRFLNTQFLAYHWKKYLKKAKVRYRSPYMLRHTYASRLLSAGIHPRYIADQMGHTSIRMVETKYYAFIEKAKPDIDAALTKAFGERVQLK